MHHTDKLAATPFWGVPTATVDWCEDNYTLSPFVAEAYNSFSNVIFFFLPLYGISWLRKLPSNGTSGSTPHLFLYKLAFTGMFVVGIGSAMFHGTLQWEWQLVDELPMLLTTLLILLGLSSTHPALPTLVRTSIRFGAIAFTLLATFAYVTSRAYATFQRAFTGLCVAVVVLIGSHLYISKFPPLPTTLALRSLLLFALGLALWHVDRFLCPDLHRARTLLGPALGTVTQMHAWWHVLSGYATYTVITLVTYFKQAQAQTGTGGISGGKEVGPRLRIEGGWVPRIVMGSVDDEGAREKGASSVGEDTPLLSSSALEKSPLASPPPPASQAPASPPVPAVSSDPARAAKKHQDDQEQEQEAIFGTAKFPKTIGRKAGKAMARGFVDM